MGEQSKIQWTDHTWNVARGCTKVDADCKFCYMYRDSERFKYDAKQVIKTKTKMNFPLTIKEPSKIFTSSLTDVFHPEIDSYRNEIWDIIRRCPQHTFQILTKRPERIADHLPPDWGPEKFGHVWLGTSVGSQLGTYRVAEMVVLTSRVWTGKIFLSMEPLHECVNIDPKILKYFDWVIVGGESGNETGKYRYRPCDLGWIGFIVHQCKELEVPVFVKQLGTYLSKEMGLKDRHGGDIDEFPTHLQVRLFPGDCYHDFVDLNDEVDICTKCGLKK